MALVYLLGLPVIACQDDGSSVTGATSVTGELARLETMTASASHSGSSGSSDDQADDESDDESDDDSDDVGDDDSDDVSDDDQSDDDSTDDDGNDDVGDSEVKGLFFGTEACTTADCVVALRIKDTLVAVTSGTEIVNRAAGDAPVSPSDLEALVAGHPGLPMKAEGSSEGGILVARELRIDDEIRATGMAVPGAPGCEFGLAVQFAELCFGLSPGVTPPAPGSTVRVEGLVPSDFSLPFLATRIEL